MVDRGVAESISRAVVRTAVRNILRTLQASTARFNSLSSILLAASSLIPIQSARADCPPETICVSVASDTGDSSQVGTFSWAIAQANAGGNQTISFDDSVFTSAQAAVREAASCPANSAATDYFFFTYFVTLRGPTSAP
jgi:hypothetical protein